jgi:serine/threonine-protein kinase
MDLERLITHFGPQPVERVIHVLIQACHSLADAHRHGLVHRDIKPANLHVCLLGLELDFVKVLDFGLARHLQLGGGARLSVAGSVLGTPSCMAPETVLRGDADARSDLYALGCVAYWMLTGSLVFNEKRAVSMMAAHAHTLPDPVSRRTELAIPPELEAIVMSLLAKDPAARPQSATELARRLAAVPVAAPWTQERADRWWQTHLPQLLRETSIEAETAALASA